MDFSQVKELTIPEGSVTQITDSLGNILWKKPKLYRELYYIETTSSSSGAYGIRLNEVATQNLKIEMKVNMASTQNYGAWVSGQGGNKYFGYADGSNFVSRWGQSQNVTAGTISDYSNNDMTLLYNRTNGNWAISGSVPGIVKQIGTGNIENICLFNQEYAIDKPSILGKCYYFKMYNSSTASLLYYDMVPAQRKSDNVIGLYDKVNHRFYTNLGSATFGAGSVVNENPDWSE